MTAKIKSLFFICLFALAFVDAGECESPLEIGSKIFVIERGSGNLSIIDYRKMALVKKIPLSGNLRHASMVFDPSLHYGYVATRNGILTRINLETLNEDGAIETSKNSIGIAISQDGKTIAVAEYLPGGITLVDAESFSISGRIPAKTLFKGKEILSRVTGLVDAPGNTFVCALMDSDEIWELGRDKKSSKYVIKRKFGAAAARPFDALITPEGRFYMTGHFKSDRVTIIDLWSDNLQGRAVNLNPAPVKGLPVKMVHMESWAVAGSKIFMSNPGGKEIAVLSGSDFSYEGSIKLIGHPVYAVVHPSHRELWVTFSGDKSDGKIQVIDTVTGETIKILDVGKRIYHLAFTPRGDKAFVASNETDELLIMDPANHLVIKRIALDSPSGIFGVWRAFQIGL